MPVLYLLNESNKPTVPGDLGIYRNINDVLAYIEPIDVANDEYFLFSTDGRKHALAANLETGEIAIEPEAEPNHVADVETLLRSHLLYFADFDKRFSIDRATVESATTIEELVSLIPEEFICSFK